MGLRVSKQRYRANGQHIATHKSTDSLSMNEQVSQPEISAQVQEFIHAKERIEAITLPANIKSQALHGGNRKSLRYKLNPSELTASLQTMFDWIEALRNLDHCQSADAYSSVSEVVDGLYDMSFDAVKSAGASGNERFTTIVDFIVDIEGPSVLYSFAQNCFEDY